MLNNVIYVVYVFNGNGNIFIILYMVFNGMEIYILCGI